MMRTVLLRETFVDKQMLLRVPPQVGRVKVGEQITFTQVL